MLRTYSQRVKDSNEYNREREKEKNYTSKGFNRTIETNETFIMHYNKHNISVLRTQTSSLNAQSAWEFGPEIAISLHFYIEHTYLKENSSGKKLQQNNIKIFSDEKNVVQLLDSQVMSWDLLNSETLNSHKTPAFQHTKKEKKGERLK